jgi:hypothetical protein
MLGATGVPVWAVALVLAVLSPFVARALATSFEENVRERTKKAFAAVGILGSKASTSRPMEDG